MQFSIADRLHAGDDEAAREVHDRSLEGLIRIARARIGGVLVAREDAEDVAQSVYRSFFRRAARREFAMDDYGDAWKVLATIAARKCRSRRRHHAAALRDTVREVVAGEGSADHREAPPEDAAMLVEAVDRLLGSLEPPERPIVELSLRGHETREIADLLSVSERKVQRVRQHARERLLAWSREEASGPVGREPGC